MDNFNIIKDGQEIIKQIRLRHTSINDIDKLIEDLNEYGYDQPNIISECIVKISVLLVNFGDVVAAYVSHANSSYIWRKFSYIWEYDKLTDKFKQVKTRENKAMEEVEQQYKDELKYSYVADWLKEREKSYYNFISTCQSRIGTLKSEMFNAKNQ